MIACYILNGHEPVATTDMDFWSRWMQSADRYVAWTEFEDGTFVSTVFMGIDHNFFGRGPPLLFETMIARYDKVNERNAWEPHQWRYSTWQEAEAGHKAAVQMIRLRKEHTLESN